MEVYLAVKAVFSFLGFSAATAATLATYTISTVVSYGLSYVALKLGEDNQQGINNDAGLKVNKIDPVAPIPVIYGRRLVGGAVVYRNLSPDNKKFYQAMVIGEGEIESVEEVYLNDTPLSYARTHYDELEPRNDGKYRYTETQRIADDPDFRKRIFRYQSDTVTELHKGEADQEASLLLQANEDWTSAHIGRDTAYLAVQLDFDRETFPNGVPQITLDVKGVKVLDIRTDTIAWSDNPALCIYDYLTNDRYGCGIPTNVIDTASFTTAANFCDELVNHLNYENNPVAIKRYTLNGVIDIDDTCLNNINKMLTSCRGMLIFSGGKYKLKIDKLESAPFFAFTETNLLGNWSVTGASKRTIANKVTTRFFNAHEKFDQSLMVVGSQPDITRDNNTIHTHDLKLDFTSVPQRADALTAMHLKQTRQEWSVEFDATIDALQVEVGDVVTITSSTTGYDAKPFRVVNMELKSDDTIHFVCNEYDDSVYSYDLNVPSVSPDTNLRSGFSPTDVNDFAVDSGTDSLLISSAGVLITRAHLTWKDPDFGFVNNYEVGYKLSTQTDEEWTTFLTPNNEFYIQPVSDGISYDFKVRAIGTNGLTGDFVYIYNHVAVGKTQPPADVQNFSFVEDRRYTQIFRWDEVSDLDLAGYEIRYHGTSSDFDNMSPLHNGLIKTNPYETTLLNEGVYNLAIKAVDTSGNKSVNANVITGEVEDDPSISIFRQDFPHLDNWSGTFFDSYIYDNKLAPKDRKNWNDFPTDSIDWDAWTTWTRDPHETRYYHEIDLGRDKTFKTIIKTLASSNVDVKVGIAKDGSSDVYEVVSGVVNSDQKFYPSGITVTYSDGSTKSFGSYIEMAGAGYVSGDGRVSSDHPDYGAKYHTLDGTPTFTALDSGASPEAHIYYIEDLGAGNNNSAWSSVLNQTTDGMWVLENLGGSSFYYKTNYSQSVPTAGITWRNVSTDAVASISLQMQNNFAEGNLYSPTYASGDLVTGRYLSVLTTVSGGTNILETLSIALDGGQLVEEREITVTTSESTSDSFTFTAESDFIKITNVQVTAEEAFVNAQVTSIDQATKAVTIAYNKTSGTLTASQSFYITIRGY